MTQPLADKLQDLSHLADWLQYQSCPIEWDKALTSAIEALTKSPIGDGVVVDGWRPIETAPKDGKPIFVSGVAGPGPWRGQPYVDIIAWRHGEWCTFDVVNSDYTYSVGDPMHWQPLPVPPVALQLHKEGK